MKSANYSYTLPRTHPQPITVETKNWNSYNGDSNRIWWENDIQMCYQLSDRHYTHKYTRYADFSTHFSSSSLISRQHSRMKLFAFCDCSNINVLIYDDRTRFVRNKKVKQYSRLVFGTNDVPHNVPSNLEPELRHTHTRAHTPRRTPCTPVIVRLWQATITFSDFWYEIKANTNRLCWTTFPFLYDTKVYAYKYSIRAEEKKEEISNKKKQKNNAQSPPRRIVRFVIVWHTELTVFFLLLKLIVFSKYQLLEVCVSILSSFQFLLPWNCFIGTYDFHNFCGSVFAELKSGCLSQSIFYKQGAIAIHKRGVLTVMWLPQWKGTYIFVSFDK